jgi:tetratricopeptide (TPR) repeat protein
MATDYCKYHPLQSATWHCTTCHISLCNDCVQPSLESDAAPTCFLCNQTVTSLHQAAPVVPFWLQYTQFMRLPLSLLGAFLLALVFAMPIFVPENMLFPMMLGSYIVAAIYGWHLLQQAATGELKDIGINVISKKTDKLTLQIGLVIAVIFVSLDVLVLKVPLLAHSLSVLLVFVLPAMLMTVAADKSIASMFQLSNIKNIVSALRFFYVPLVAASLLLLMISSAVIGLLADILSSQVTQGLEQALYGYSLWVMMSVVGYVLFEFHQVLDFEVLGQKKKKHTVSKVQDKQQARLAVYLKEGAYEKAAALLKTQSEKQKNNPEIQEKYYQLLIFMQDAELVPIQASHYMEALLEVGQVPQALDVLMKVRRLVPDFMPPTPEMRFHLAKACVDNQYYELARDLLRQLHKEYPHYPQLPEAYLLLSKVLHEKLKASTEALETMEYLASRFQKHPRYDLIERFWRSLGGKPKEDFIL